MADFVHLHLHSVYSLLDGACRIKDIVRAAAEMGQKAVALTDHGVMYGAVDFYKEAKKNGIKPIIGCEMYMAARTMADRVFHVDSTHSHLVLLCKDNEGYRNLIKLVSAGWIDGFYGKPRIDFSLLQKHSKGLIALSACLSGEIPRLLAAGDYDGAKRRALQYKELFGGDFYLELQDHGLPQQKILNPQLVRLSAETGIGTVVTNDVHFMRRSDYSLQKVMLCIQMNKTVEDNVGFGSDEFYMKNTEEMEALFPQLPEAYENTVKIAEQCNVEFEFGKTILPHFEVPNGQDHFEYFKAMCENGLVRHYSETPPAAVRERLDYELGVIRRMGFVDYYLIVYDFIRYAKSRGIPVGPGRGSGAGSLAAYCIGITGIDPIKYNLLFERFLNPERVSMPDFDIDFCYERRQEVINYVIRKYGSDHVAQIVTFGTMAARAAIRDVGRVMNLPYGTVDMVAKKVPMEPNMTIDRALASSEGFKKLYDGGKEIKELVDMARRLEGMPRHTSTHAAGVVITRDPVDSYVPLQKNDESIVTQYTMTTLEELGLLKMDFLGLRNLTVIKDASDMIAEKTGGFDIENIPTDDKKVYDLLGTGNTMGIFQLESAGMRQTLINLRPENMEDIIAVISLYRPGPMESIPKYIENRHNPSKIQYKHPLLENILNVTYGCIVYQEQVMEIVRRLGGYSYGRADLVRRAMAKKKTAVMEQERVNFIHGIQREDGTFECVGAVRNGVDEKTANEIFDEMAGFASYAFNKSHAAAYALIAYRTAYLKCYYPKEYFSALLTSVLDSADKVSVYINECARLHIKVFPPDINESRLGFSAVGEGIRFGLLAVKNLGRNFINDILEERKNGNYTSFTDFCSRMLGRELNRRMLESLIKCGAFDSLHYKRRQLLIHYEEIVSALEETRRNNITGQMNMFSKPDGESGPETAEHIPHEDEFEMRELLRQEKDVIGFYLSGHPLLKYKELYTSGKAVRIAEILSSNENDPSAAGEGRFGENGKTAFANSYADGKEVTLLGIVRARQIKSTKNNETMAFVTLDDGTGSIESVVFPKIFQRYGALFDVDEILLIKGKLSVREEEAPKILCDGAMAADDLSVNEDSARSTGGKQRKTGKRGLFLKLPAEKSEKYERVKKLLAVFDGPFPVYLYFEDQKKYYLAPKTMWVAMNDVLKEELENILGKDNVVEKGWPAKMTF